MSLCGTCCFTLGSARSFTEPLCLGRRVWYVAYRWLPAVVFAALLIYISIISTPKILIYWGFWALILLTLNVILQAICITYSFYNGVDPIYMPPHLQVIWLLQNISYPAVLLAAFVYWVMLVAVQQQPIDLSIPNITMFIVAPAYVILDSFISDIPVYFLHIYQPVLLAAVYVVFTVIYWSAGGTNLQGQPYIYNYINYGTYPRDAGLWAAGFALVAMPVIHMVRWLLYWLLIKIRDMNRMNRPYIMPVY